MSNSPEIKSQSFNLSILSQQPKSQLIEMQNTNPNQPIQLRVDTVTDYSALFITILVSLVTALISAYVTIRIVTKSNNELIKNQNDLENNRLKIEKENQLALLTSKNRQDWINELRSSVAEVISESTNITYNLREMLDIKHKQNNMGDLDFTVFMSSYQKVDSLITKVSLFLNVDKQEQQELYDELLNLKTNLLAFCNLNLSPDRIFYLSPKLPVLRESLKENLNNVSQKTSIIIKVVWGKTKAGI